MKTRISLLTLAVLFVAMISCTPKDKPLQPIDGVWNLHKVHGGLAGINVDYNVGDVKWDFDSNTEMVKIENNIETTGPEQIYGGPATGDYSFELNSLNDLLKIDDEAKGNMTIVGDTMTIDDGVAADGLFTILVK